MANIGVDSQLQKHFRGLPMKKSHSCRRHENRISSKHQLNIICSSGVMAGVLLYLAFAGAGVFGIQLSSTLVDKKCLNCVCQAMSGCNYSIGCSILDKKVCGPYNISFSYWLDGGKVGNTVSHTENEDYEACSINIHCAEATMQNYFRLYYKDCNGNSIIDCVDFFRTHYAGPYLCMDESLESKLPWLKFLECYLNTAKSTKLALRSIRSADSV